MTAIAPIAHKLKPLLLLLSSDKDGEALAACLALGRLLKKAHCDFHDLANGLTAPVTAKPPPQSEDEAPPKNPRDWRVMRDLCLVRASRLREHELKFVANLKKWRGDLTPKQVD
jgi:hypothetical protein